MKENSYVSTTAVVKGLIREFMSDGTEKDRKDIVNYINENMGQNDRLTDGVIAGAIKLLTANGELEVVARGRYKKGMGQAKETSSFEKIYHLCSKFEADLDKACTVNIMSLSDGERSIYNDFVDNLVYGKLLVGGMVGNLKGLLDSIAPVENVVSVDELVKEEPLQEEEKQPEVKVEEEHKVPEETALENPVEVPEEIKTEKSENEVSGESVDEKEGGTLEKNKGAKKTSGKRK